MENTVLKPNLLDLQINLSATPAVSFQSSIQINEIQDPSAEDNFSVVLDSGINYNELSDIVNRFLQNKKFDIIDGIINRYIIIQSFKLYGTEENTIRMDVTFGGSFTGKLYITGKPYYDTANKTISLQEVGYNLDSNDFLLKTVKWLFNKKIMELLQKYTSRQLALYYGAASEKLNEFLNKEYSKDIGSMGTISTIQLTGVTALPQHLQVKSNCTGHITLLVKNLNLGGSR